MHAEQMEITPDLSIPVRALLGISSHRDNVTDLRHIPVVRKMIEKMMRGERLRFVLPAFPAKSPNPLKTMGKLPDLGEVLALQRLNDFCGEVTGAYAPGAEVIICSDGRVFSDVVSVSDEDISAYGEGIEVIIREFHLTHLKTFSMEDLRPELRPSELRKELLQNYAMAIEEVRSRAQAQQFLFNGLHRFLVEDHLGLINASKNQLSKMMKPRALELMRRSDAWSALLNDYFPDCLRLSIHPHELTSEKFGVSLVPGEMNWATPWHNVTVKRNGEFILMHRSRAEALGGTIKNFGGKYAYFEL